MNMDDQKTIVHIKNKNRKHIEDEDFKTWYGVVSLTLHKNIVKTFKEKANKDQSWNDKHIQKEMSEANAYL